ncbi:MAG: SAM-dependent methyltransferase, partial [Candidatus Micrarchaeota archaeon]|nr:SAM-dependent methyltransferase [Candidatus Micrarchaeota archaeon]
TQVIGNAFDVLPLLDAGSFDVACHDPPRLSMAGELYGLAFYRELFRVLRRGGKLFHYTGAPGKKSGKNISRGVKARLLEAGFSGIRWHEDLQGFTAHKR